MDYEAEILKLKRLNKTKEVNNMREGRTLMKKHEHKITNTDYRDLKAFYLGLKEKSYGFKARIKDTQERIDKFANELKDTDVRYKEAIAVAEKEQLYAIPSDKARIY